MTKPYYDHNGITIYHGDCREILPEIEADRLITDPVWPNADPQTSKIAAALARELRSAHRARILAALARIGTGTGIEIAQAAGLDRHQVQRRLGELVRDGALRLTGDLRLTPSGRPAQVYGMASR